MLGHRFHHVGIACSNIDETSAFVLNAFEIVSDSGVVHDPEQGADVRIFNRDTPLAIELVSGPVVEKLIQRGTTYYHLCFATADIESSIAKAVELGAVCVREPRPAVLFEGRRVAFVFTPLGLVEFVEQP